MPRFGLVLSIIAACQGQSKTDTLKLRVTMTISGDWITPRLEDLKYFEKPPLQYWITAAAKRNRGAQWSIDSTGLNFTVPDVMELPAAKTAQVANTPMI